MHEVRTISEILNQIRRGEILLPEFQRGYVWNSDQVRGLVQSLYRKHPTGHLLVWKTYKPSPVRGGQATFTAPPRWPATPDEPFRSLRRERKGSSGVAGHRGGAVNVACPPRTGEGL